MAINSDALQMTLQVTNVLEKMGIQYAVGGSLSSSVHGMMRATMDVDIVADMHMEQVDGFVVAMSPYFYADDEMIRDAILRKSSFNLIHLETAYKVDVFIPKDRIFDRNQLERRVLSSITSESDKSIYVTSAEDIILSKLEWFRMGGEMSDRQWRDILGVIKMRDDELDTDYLLKMAKNLNVLDLLEKALK